jgi:hypothetical protein
VAPRRAAINAINILCMSDIHCLCSDLVPESMPQAVVCVVAGDITHSGMRDLVEMQRARAWMHSLAEYFP